ncbi:hypothetical protein DFR42_11950 [Undibacterium pigrum]|uniref:Uncharacterized protein n=2 Tax=Undibacterium pigrum TaxID=401470 RepID=A0A318IPB5_9BURK|nr:hypothetical protein DFR42_11950 [Undibacterium pigrum]
MTPQKAKTILESLALGIHPETGEALPDQGIFNQPQIIRALFLATQALNAGEPRAETATTSVTTVATGKSLPTNAGKPWTTIDDTELLTAFDAGAQVSEIAREFERSRGSINSRLVRLGRLQEADKTSEVDPGNS